MKSKFENIKQKTEPTYASVAKIEEKVGQIIKISKNKSAIIKSQSSKDGKVIIHFDERDDIK